MDRRTFVAEIMAVGAASLVAGRALAQGKDAAALPSGAAARPKGPASAHAGHPAATAQSTTRPAAPPFSKLHRALLDTAAECMITGELCLAHCADNLGAGDTAMAECQRSVMNMLAMVEATQKLVAYRSTAGAHLKTAATLCAELCRACEKACEPHVAHHDECRACRDACRRCAAACDALVKG